MRCVGSRFDNMSIAVSGRIPFCGAKRLQRCADQLCNSRARLWMRLPKIKSGDINFTRVATSLEPSCVNTSSPVPTQCICGLWRSINAKSLCFRPLN